MNNLTWAQDYIADPEEDWILFYLHNSIGECICISSRSIKLVYSRIITFQFRLLRVDYNLHYYLDKKPAIFKSTPIILNYTFRTQTWLT